MCGIAGIAFLDADAVCADIGDRISAMEQAEHYRGPDDGGVYISPDSRVALANRRLAIRDLSAAGHMPMASSNGLLWITYNGEIYNAGELRNELEALGYSFRSHSDTEVILQGYEAWGSSVVERLRGMFAFAIYDRRRDPACLFIARDRLGIKPLYYARTGQAFLFASELKSLLASRLVDRQIDPAAVVAYLLLGSVPNPQTIYTEVHALEAGHMMIIPLDGSGLCATPRQYWRLSAETDDSVTYSQAVEQVRTLLEESVRLHMVSDVPLGAFLSGGIDSSSIAVLMRDFTGGAIRTCSMIFEEQRYSEADYARQVAASIGAEHFERVITAQDVEEHLPNIFFAMDQPTLDGVNTYFVSRTAKEAGLTVAMSGLGGDELFGGYANTFTGVPQLTRWLTRIQAIPAGPWLARSFLGAMPKPERWYKARDALGRPASAASAYFARRGLFSPAEVRELVPDDVWQAAQSRFEPVAHIAERAGDAEESFGWVSRAELSMYTQHQLLRDTDVMSMIHSLEVRVPLLDHRLVEAVLRIPGSLKRAGMAPKPLLVDAVGDRLPRIVRERRQKQGFVFPFDTWMRTYLKKPLTATLFQEIPELGLSQRKKAHIWNAYLDGRMHWSRAWALIALYGWMGMQSGTLVK